MPTQATSAFRSFVAGEALTQHYCVILDPSNDDTVLLPTADNMRIAGIVDDDVLINKFAPVHLLDGTTRYAISHAAITKGALLSAKSGGKVDTAGSSGTVNVVGIALESATNSNQHILIQTLFTIVKYS